MDAQLSARRAALLLQKAGVYQREQPQYTLLPQEHLVSGSESELYAVIIAGISAPNGMIRQKFAYDRMKKGNRRNKNEYKNKQRD